MSIILPEVDRRIVGRGVLPYEVIARCELFLLKCKCRSTNKPMTIYGIEGAAVCPECNCIYFIDSINYDRGEHRMNLVIGYDRSKVVEKQ